MADSVLPEDIMISILTRLPVKSLLRFKSVCKPWLELIASPVFVKMHHDQFSSDPKTRLSSSTILLNNTFTKCLFKIESDENKPTNLDHPYPEIFFTMDFVGSCNGLLCMCYPPLRQSIILWNPAMKLFKFVRPSKVHFGEPNLVSVGYDDERDDFKVVRIVCLKGAKVEVEVYSAKSDNWKTITPGDFQINGISTKNDAIVNGNLYWAEENPNSERGFIWFDVKKMVWERVHLANLSMKFWAHRLVEWKGSIAALLSSESKCEKHHSNPTFNIRY